MKLERPSQPQPEYNPAHSAIFSHLFPGACYDTLPDTVNLVSRVQLHVDMFREGKAFADMIYNCEQAHFFVVRFDPGYVDKAHFDHLLEHVVPIEQREAIIPNEVKKNITPSEKLGGMGKERIGKYEVTVIGVTEGGHPKGFIWFNHGLASTTQGRREVTSRGELALFPI